MTALAAVITALSTALLAAALLVALANLLTAPRLERAGAPRRRPRVSLLVPARDEEANLAAHLPAWLALDYPELEILVLDDDSSDGTAARVEEHLPASGGRLRLLRGAPLPEGWLVKSWACHQLAAASTGEVLLFCDADVATRADAVALTVALMERGRADALTALPRHHLGGWTERAVVPLVTQIPVLALLPLRLVPEFAAPSLSMANGQWLAFTRGAYRATGGHAAVRGSLVEDVELGRTVTRAGLRLLPAVAARALEVRMYGSPRAVREGFPKNLYPLVGARPGKLALGLVGLYLLAVHPWLALLAGVPGAVVGFVMLGALRAAGALLFRHGWGSVLLHPVGSLMVGELALRSLTAARRGGAVWKGRPLRVGAGA